MDQNRRILPYRAPPVDDRDRGPSLRRRVPCDPCVERPAATQARAQDAGLASA
jgi:hypothetical protein